MFYSLLPVTVLQYAPYQYILQLQIPNTIMRPAATNLIGNLTLIRITPRNESDRWWGGHNYHLKGNLNGLLHWLLLGSKGI